MKWDNLSDRVQPLFRHRGRHRSRGVSFTVSYVLTVAISVVLIAGLLLTAGQVVIDHRTETIRGEASVVGDQTAAAVMAADRLVQSGNNSNTSIALRLPERLAERPYTVTLRATTSNAVIVVRTRSPSVVVSTPLTNRTQIKNKTVTGPDVRVVYQNGEHLTLMEGRP